MKASKEFTKGYRGESDEVVAASLGESQTAVAGRRKRERGCFCRYVAERLGYHSDHYADLCSFALSGCFGIMFDPADVVSVLGTVAIIMGRIWIPSATIGASAIVSSSGGIEWQAQMCVGRCVARCHRLAGSP